MSLKGGLGAMMRLMSCRVADGDEFIQKLWDIHLKVEKEGYTQVGHISFSLAHTWS